MANGGTAHECYLCKYYVIRNFHCKLRKLNIDNYLRTYCKNIISRRLGGRGNKELIGPLYSIVTDHGRYCELPYFENRRVEKFIRGKGETIIFTDSAGRYYLCNSVPEYLAFYEQCSKLTENLEEFKKVWREEQRRKIMNISKNRSRHRVVAPTPMYENYYGIVYDVVSWSKSHIGFTVSTWSSEKFWLYSKKVLRAKGVVETCKELSLKSDDESKYALWLIRSIAMRRITWNHILSGIPFSCFGWVAHDIYTKLTGSECSSNRFINGDIYYGAVGELFFQLKSEDEWKLLDKAFNHLRIR